MSNLIEVSTLGDLLLRAAQTHPGRDALVLPDARISYAALLERATGIARSLTGLGLPPRSNIGILIPNSVEIVEAMFGIALHGSVAVPLHVRHKASELGFIIKDANLSAVLTSFDPRDPVPFPEVLETALPALRDSAGGKGLRLPETPDLRHLVLLRGAARPGFIDRPAFDNAGAGVSAESVMIARSRVKVRDLAMIIYTSGTTANPKGCMISHEAATRGPVERAKYRFSVGDHNIAWGPGPLFHIGTLSPFIGSIGVAGTWLTDHYYEPGRAIELMAANAVTFAVPWFPAIVQGVLDHQDFDPDKLATLRHLLIIATETLANRVIQTLPLTEIIQGCGMTETAGIYAISDPEDTAETRIKTQGKACPGIELRIVDHETGTDCPPGQPGEIWVRGYNVMDGYWKDPKKTAQALTEDGWLRTGDLYIRDKDGNVLFNGRLKDMLKVGGENVAAIEVEAFLCSHPDVKIAEVVGRPDPRLDEVPVAFVELRPGSTLQPEGLIEFCRGKIANYKIPRAVFFVEPADWPMSATKVNKVALRERLSKL